jgi:hypothetical protein
MSDMTAVLVAVVAFTMAAAARLGDGTETNPPEAEPRRSMAGSDRQPGHRSVVTEGDEP